MNNARKTKKGCIGCLGVGAVLLLAGVILLYTLFLRPVMDGVSALRDIHKVNEEIENQAVYQSPQSDELTAEQVERFVAVQSEIHERLGPRYAEFQEKFEELAALGENHRELSFFELLNRGLEISQLYNEAKKVQVDALNRQDFSLDEYHWVRQSFYRAVGVELASFNIDEIAKTASEDPQSLLNLDIESFQEQQDTTLRTEVPSRNRELVRPYAEQIDEWMMYARWGL